MTHATESRLAPCHECGQPISQRARACVKCACRTPFATCDFCNEPLKPSLAWFVSHDEHILRYRGRHFHPSCVNALLPVSEEPITCVDCGSFLEWKHRGAPRLSLDPGEIRFPSLNGGAFLGPCSNCGHPAPHVGHCVYCGLLILPRDAVHRGGDDGVVRGHAACYRLRAKKIGTPRYDVPIFPAEAPPPQDEVVSPSHPKGPWWKFW
jgi:hypothetical protein